MNTGKIIVAGIGPGSPEDITPAVLQAVAQSEVIVGYKYYFRFIESFLSPDAITIDTGMKKEKERAEEAFNYAMQGKTVCVISSGDAGIYGMAPLVWEMREEKNCDIPIEVLPGISAFQKASALLGAPIGHDFCIISMSDLMTPWRTIEKRIQAAATADFITAIYNPRSMGRYWQLDRLKEIFLEERAPSTPVGYVRQAGREEQTVCVTTLKDFSPEEVDMFTIVIIGNSQTYIQGNRMITPRGYYREEEVNAPKIGQEIMIRSFRTINGELKNPNISDERRWPLLHAIHTTADFEMEDLLYIDEGAMPTWYQKVQQGELRYIISDVTMVTSGIRKGALNRLGIEALCYLHDPRVEALAAQQGITRTQAGIRLAVEEHPDALFVFGNAPTALMELCELIRKGKANPCGVIASPVGFVNVCESKYMIKSFRSVPKIIIEGRKGGSNLAATLVNSILSFEDVSQLRPGRDL